MILTIVPIMSCLAGMSGWCFGFTFLKERTQLYVPFLFLLILLIGVSLTTYTHMSEIGYIRNTPTQLYQPYLCVLEDTAQCNQTAGQLTNESYSDFTNGYTKSFTYYIGISIIDKVLQNIGTYFIIGIIFGWITILGINDYERRKKEV